MFILNIFALTQVRPNSWPQKQCFIVSIDPKRAESWQIKRENKEKEKEKGHVVSNFTANLRGVKMGWKYITRMVKYKLGLNIQKYRDQQTLNINICILGIHLREYYKFMF